MISPPLLQREPIDWFLETKKLTLDRNAGEYGWIDKQQNTGQAA